MKRYFIPGAMDRHGVARPNALAHLRCTGHCEADLPCECEMACDIAPDAARVIQPPTRTPEDDSAVAYARRWALFLAVVTFSALAALLGISDPRFTP